MPTPARHERPIIREFQSATEPEPKIARPVGTRGAAECRSRRRRPVGNSPSAIASGSQGKQQIDPAWYGLGAAAFRSRAARSACYRVFAFSETLAAGPLSFRPSSTLTESPFLTFASACGGKWSFIEPSDVLTSTHPFFGSTFV